MYSVSDEIIEQLNNNNRQTAILTVTLASGDTLAITEANIIQGGLMIDRASVSGSKLELGSAIAAELSLKLRNFDGEYDDITFEGAEIDVQIGVLSDDETEVTYIPAGVFVVDEEPRSLSTVTVSALDRMVLFDKDVEWDSLSFPCTVSELADQVCDICGVTCATDMATLINYSYSIPAQPTDETTTYRVLIQWIAGLTGTNAFMDWNGELVFSWYENETGITIDKTKRYSSDIYENALNITGVCYTYTETATDSDGNETEEEITYMAGNDGYYIDLSENLLIQDEYEELLDNIYNKIFSLNYLPYEMGILPAPYFFPMDVVTITDRKGTEHSSIITNVNYTLNGSTVIKAQGETSQSDSYSSGSGLTAEQAAAIAALRTDISAFGTVITNYMYATNATIETLNANYASIEELIATYATIEYLQTYYLTASEITATYATIETLESVTASIKDLFSDYASILYLEANYVTTGALAAEIANITEAYITSAAVTELLADYATVTELNAVSATIGSLSSSYAEIDFSNVDVSNVVTEFVSDLLTAQGFLASSATIDTISVTSYLTGVGIIADYITAGTLDCTNITVANLSVGVLTVDSINGYTLAGSTVDADNLEELLTQIMDAITTTDDEVAEALEAAGLVTAEVSTLSSTVITDIEIQYYLSTSSETTTGGSWSSSAPEWTEGTYVWTRNLITYGNGSAVYSDAVCVTGNSGSSGSDGADGSDGSDGVGVKSITNYYLLSTSNTDYESEYSSSSALVDYAIVDSAAVDYTDWSTAVSTMTAEYKYLWCYTVIEYTDGSTSVCEPYVLGTYGDTGEDGADGQMLYATCSTAASTAAKVATLVSGDLELTSGSTVTVTFTYANAAASPTLNIESTGAKSIYLSGAIVSSTNEYDWEAGSTITFVYDGSYWVVSDAGATAAIATVTSIASGKSTTYFSDTAPSSSDFDLQENDIWFDTDDDNAMYMYDGTAWEKCEYGTSAIAASAITAELIAAGAVTTAKIAAGAVTSNEIAANTITAANILAGTITSSEIDTDSIATAVLSATYIQASTLSIGSDSDGNVIISNGKITADMIDAETITGDMIVSQTITATQIAAGTITSNEIDVSSITAAILTAGSITATMIASGAVTADKISVSDLSALGATIGGFAIGTTALYSNADTYEGANNVYLGMNGISLGDTFSVDSTGNLSATQGTIGAITLSSTGLYACNMSEESGVVGVGTADNAVADTITADNYAGIYKPSTISSSSIAFFAGATSAAGASATFSVTYGGTMTATDAVISGTITATSGTIGAITIGSHGLYAYNSSYSSSYAGIYRPSTITTSSKAFFAGSTSYTGTSATFYVTYGGSLTATDATLTGSITSESGYYKAILTSGNLDFYYDGDEMMSYGSTVDSSDSSVRGARFGMTYDCDFMSFSRKLTSTTSNYTSWLAYSYSGDFTGYADTAYLACEFVAPYFIQTGRYTFTDSVGGTSHYVYITFKAEFPGTPRVIVTPHTAYPRYMQASVTSVSSTGFYIRMHLDSDIGDTATDRHVSWIAVYTQYDKTGSSS